MSNESLREKIKNVALYLRKSRDENQDDALVKHRQKLLRLCKDRHWVVKDIYAEIITGAKLDVRTEMLRLISNLHLYDAVVVVDLDRLGRNNIKEWGIVTEAFKKASVLIVTPGAIYDLNNTNDEFVMNISGVVNHHEYQRILTRFYDGKIEGAVMGRWTNGKPPFGYKYVKKIYHSNGKDIVVGEIEPHPEQVEVYRLIIDLFLQDQKSTQQITEILNKRGYPSPGGGLWHNNTVHRILTGEVHLGKVFFGKTKGRWDKTTQSGGEAKPRSEWVIGKGQHLPLKTQNEHDEILLTLERNRRRPVAARKGTYPLSGLLYCKRCGHRMRFYTKRRKHDTVVYTKCDYYGPFGKECDQKGTQLTDDVYNHIVEQIKNEYVTPERLASNAEQKSIYDQKKKEIQSLNRELKFKANAKQRAEKLYIEGIEDISFYKKYKARYDNEIEEISSRVRALTKEIEHLSITGPEELEEQITEFLEKWGAATTNQEKNELFATIINKAWYDKNNEADEVIIEIEYL